MKTSPAGIALICRFEGCRLDAYPDPGVGWNLPTVGYGHTGAGVSQGLHIDQARAEELLASDLANFEHAVLGAVHVPLTQCQFDALVSFAYNVKGWQGSTLIRLCNAGDFAGAAAEFPKWDHAPAADGHMEVLPGLVLRRAAEQRLFRGLGNI
jgi:lysozyme